MGINLSLQVGHEKNFKKAEELNKKENAEKNKKGKEKKGSTSALKRTLEMF